jgi:hypothetical protein
VRPQPQQRGPGYLEAPPHPSSIGQGLQPPSRNRSDGAQGREIPHQTSGQARGRTAVARKYSKHQLLLGAGVLVVLIQAVVLTWGLGRLGVFNTRELDIKRAQTGVQQVLTDPINGYGRNNVTDVRCNNGRNPVAKTGDQFTCEVNINGARRHVMVVFADNNGTYAVDGPR